MTYLIPSIPAEDARPRVLLAALGDANLERTWSGIPHHILTYGKAQGVFDGGLELDTAAAHWRRRRFAWNVFRFATSLEFGSYQFSESFLQRLWKCADLRTDDTLINVFPLYPVKLFQRHAGAKWFYIDQTLNQAFSLYDLRVGRRMAADAVARERSQYRMATGVITQSEWAARDVIETYGIPRERVHVALAGANIAPDVLAAWELGRTFQERPPNRPLRLVFVGKDWKRKGLDRLLRAAAMVRSAGAAVEVVVIGVDRSGLPSELARAEGTIWAGFIDKHRALPLFLDTVAECDVGCLLSRAEAGGISLREFWRLGLPTLGPDVGGSPEYVIREASDLVRPDAPDHEIAAKIGRLARDRSALAWRRRVAFSRRHEATWDAAIDTIGRLVGRPGTPAQPPTLISLSRRSERAYDA